jgi:hypothetical protein
MNVALAWLARLDLATVAPGVDGAAELPLFLPLATHFRAPCENAPPSSSDNSSPRRFRWADLVRFPVNNLADIVRDVRKAKGSVRGAKRGDKCSTILAEIGRHDVLSLEQAASLFRDLDPGKGSGAKAPGVCHAHQAPSVRGTKEADGLSEPVSTPQRPPTLTSWQRNVCRLVPAANLFSLMTPRTYGPVSATHLLTPPDNGPRRKPPNAALINEELRDAYLHWWATAPRVAARNAEEQPWPPWFSAAWSRARLPSQHDVRDRVRAASDPSRIGR